MSRFKLVAEITELTTIDYEEKKVGENPILEASGAGWNRNGMHHIDPHQQIDEDKWIASGWMEKGFGCRLQIWFIRFKRTSITIAIENTDKKWTGTN